MNVDKKENSRKNQEFKKEDLLSIKNMGQATAKEILFKLKEFKC